MMSPSPVSEALRSSTLPLTMYMRKKSHSVGSLLAGFWCSRAVGLGPQGFSRDLAMRTRDLIGIFTETRPMAVMRTLALFLMCLNFPMSNDTSASQAGSAGGNPAVGADES